jgi:site-specific recombinase
MKKGSMVLGAVGGIVLFLSSFGSGWTVGGQAAFWDCVERIKYDPALRHLCE